MVLSSVIVCNHNRRIADDRRSMFPYDRRRSQTLLLSAIRDHMETSLNGKVVLITARYGFPIQHTNNSRPTLSFISRRSKLTRSAFVSTIFDKHGYKVLLVSRNKLISKRESHIICHAYEKPVKHLPLLN